MAEEVLKLSTRREARRIVVDECLYGLRDRGELSLAQTIALQGLSEKFLKFKDIKEPAELEQLSRDLREAVRVVVPLLPEGVESALGDMDRLEILTAFFKVPGRPAPEGSEASRKELQTAS